MTETDELKMLKLNLDMISPSDERTEQLTFLLKAAKRNIEATGIHLMDDAGDVDDAQLVVMYAAWLYRKRSADNQAMPRMLDYALKNRVWKEIGGRNA